MSSPATEKIVKDLLKEASQSSETRDHVEATAEALLLCALSNVGEATKLRRAINKACDGELGDVVLSAMLLILTEYILEVNDPTDHTTFVLCNGIGLALYDLCIGGLADDQ